ncbi:hypothetical protein AAVH_32282, partial [Aphelenchoides avenae]
MSDDFEATSSKISLQLAKEIARNAHTSIKTHFPEASPAIVDMPKSQKPSGSGTSAAATAAPEVKRKRGRPRKVQAPPAEENVTTNQSAAATPTTQAASDSSGRRVGHNGYELKMGEQTEAFVFWNCTTPGCGGTAMMKVGEKRLSDLEPHNAECVQAHSTPGNGEGTHAMNQSGGEPSSGEPIVKHQRKASPGRSAQAQQPTKEADERQSRASPRPTHGMRTRSRSRGRDSASPELGAARRGRSSSKSREDIRGISPSIAAMRTRSSSQSATPPTRPGPSSSTVAAAHKPQIVFGPKPREVSATAANRFVKPMTVVMAPHVQGMGSFELEEEDEEEQAEEKEQDDEEQVDEEAPADEGSDVRGTEAGKDATAGAEDGVKTAAEPESDIAEGVDEEQVEEELDEEEVMLVEDEEMFAGLQETIANM